MDYGDTLIVLIGVVSLIIWVAHWYMEGRHDKANRT